MPFGRSRLICIKKWLAPKWFRKYAHDALSCLGRKTRAGANWMRRAGVKPICSKCLVSPLDSVVIQHPSIQSPQYRPQTLNFRLPRPITAHRFVLKTQNAEVWRISCEWKLVCVHGLFVKIIMSEEFRFFISIKTAHSAGPRFLSKHGNMKPSTGVSARDWSIDLWMWNGRPEALKFLLFVSDKLNIDSDT